MENRSDIAAFLEYGLEEEALVLNRDFEVVCVNEFFLNRLGLLERDVVGKHCYEVLPNCKNTCGDPSRECPIREAISTHAKVSITQQDATSGGESGRHFRIDVYPVKPPESQDTHYLLINRDITNQVEEERTKEEMWMAILGRMEHLFTSIIGEGEKVEHTLREIDHLIDILPVAFVRWDLRGNIIKWNPAAEVVFGWREKDMVGEQLTSFFASGSSQDNLNRLKQEILQGRTMAYSLAENRTASGKIITCDWHHAAALREGGEMAGGISMANDVTERLVTLTSMKKTKDLLESLLETTGEAIIAITPLGRISLWNKAAEKIFGWKVGEIIGKEPELIVPEEKREDFRKSLQDGFSEEEKEYHCVFEATMVGKDSKQFPAQVSLRLISMGDKPMMLAQILDIAEKKQFEKNLLASENIRVLGEMASGVAHDFNNILSVILGYTQLLKDKVKEDEEKTLLDEIEIATRKGASASASIINKLYDPTKKQDNDFTLTGLTEAVNEVLELTRYRWQDQPQRDGATIAVTADFAETPPVFISFADFREMLTNIIFNAVDAMPRGGCLHLSSAVNEQGVLLTIEDNGQGINPEEIKHIFRPFYSTKGLSHTGMGLSIAQSLAARQGAEISVQSSKGVGATFTIMFPLLATCPYPDKIDQTKRPRFKILVMDNESQVRNLIQYVLTKKGHTVDTAVNGREGVKLFREKQFDLVITDLGMPEMSGLDAAVHMKKRDPSVPIIIITGWGENLEQERPKADLIDAVIGKPFDIEKLFALVERIGNRAKGFSR
jgi:PAS domain S-box-containing protein